MGRKILIVGGASVLSFAIGAVSGYFFAKKVPDNKIDLDKIEIEEKPIITTQDMPPLPRRVIKYNSPQDAVAALIDGNQTSTPDLERIIKGLRYNGEQPPLITNNIFEQLKREQQVREEEQDPDSPYILSQYDFMNGEVGYEQVTFTYFEGDEVLVDENEDPVENSDDVVGLKNLRFGCMSEDPNVVYIRNEKLRYDFEVIRSTGKYTVEVLGEEDSDSKKELQLEH